MALTRPGALRLWAILGAAILATAVAIGCAASEPPPRSPFEDTATAPPNAGTPRPLPTFPATETATASPTTASTSAPTVLDEERIIGEAISRLAEWTGAREVDVRFESIEEVEWPSACLGIDIPGIACAEVITPGYRVSLSILGGPQYVHASQAGNYAWAPTFEASGRVIEEIDTANGIIVLEALNGSDEMGRRHAVTPGSYLEVPLAELNPGDAVALGTTHGLISHPEDVSAIVWLVPVE